MNWEENWVKTLCDAFQLPEVNWLPASVVYLLSYLLTVSSPVAEGDVLYLKIGEDVATVQLLTILPVKEEIVVERAVHSRYVYNQSAEQIVRIFLQEVVLPYIAALGVKDQARPEFNLVLLDTDNDLVNNLSELINHFLGMMPIVILKELPEALKNVPETNISGSQTFNSVYIICPHHFFIKKRNTTAEGSQWELIPFAYQDLALNISKSYKIFSLGTDSEYNLTDSKNQVKLKLYIGDSSPPDNEKASGPGSFFEYAGEVDDKNSILNIFFNLRTNRFEFDHTHDKSALPDRNILQELHQLQVNGYDFVNSLCFIDSNLLSDYGQYLKQTAGQEFSSPHLNRTIYFQALTLLDLLSVKK